VAGDWKRLHSKQLHNLHVSPNTIRIIKSRRVKWAGLVAGMGEITNTYKILVEKPEGKRPLGQSRCRWEDNIRMDLREIGWESIERMHLAQDRNQWAALVKW
jgi:hypothetical protein